MQCCLQGKSLSLICGALRWLEDSEKRDREKMELTLAGCDGTIDTEREGEDTSDGTCMAINRASHSTNTLLFGVSLRHFKDRSIHTNIIVCVCLNGRLK